ncbi:MAG: hypothetical protein WAW96_05545 [Alphaproteobacteria bacterium]
MSESQAEKRLAEALRANLRRRKTQARSRAEIEPNTSRFSGNSANARPLSSVKPEEN